MDFCLYWTIKGGDLLSKNELKLKRLEGITGSEIFKEILEVFSGDRIYFPGRGDFSSIAERNEAIWKDFCQNMSIPDLASNIAFPLIPFTE